MSDKNLKIKKVKGRAMLHWVGKKPIESVESYPAQLVETVGDVKPLETPSYDTLENDWSNLLFHGDNKEILSTLLTNGFRGKVDLIYIDPPFDSKADYVRRVELRGTKSKLDGEEQTAIEQVQYEDIWANDNYLQFMYERLILLRELLSDKGSIYLHCDWHKSHHLRILMDEVFGSERFINTITWGYRIQGVGKNTWARKHDDILVYSKTDKYIFHPLKERVIYEKPFIDTQKESVDLNKISDKELSKIVAILQSRQALDPKYKTLLFDKYYSEVYTRDVWDNDDTKPFISGSSEYLQYPTQKPEGLLNRIIAASSDEDSIILDAFIGSGTTTASAQKLGRRWIGTDINKGAIQTTMKRLQKIGEEQSEQPKILHYRVNNYDFQQISALRAIIVEKYGIEESKTDSYFDGTVGQRLVKIAELNKPVTKLDIQGIIDEIKNRPDEDRDILLIGSGVELGVDALLTERQQLAGSVNKIEVKDIQTDGVIVAEPAETDVTIDKKGDKVAIKINSYISPTIIKRLDLDRSIFGEHIKDFRAQIDTVMIDTDYDGKTFNVVHSDVPAKKSDFVVGEYALDLPRTSKKVAVKITDMLGEELLMIG